MGLILFAAFSALVIGTIGLSYLWWPPADPISFMRGAVHMLLLAGAAFGLPVMFRYFTTRGWVASPADWWRRSQFAVTNDWRAIDARGWDVDLLRLRWHRDKTKGTFVATLSVLGININTGVLIDEGEYERFYQQILAKREEALAQMPLPVREAMRAMMQEVPLDSSIEIKGVTAHRNPMHEDISDDDDDDDSGNRGGVH